jgi:hypothetical protein
MKSILALLFLIATAWPQRGFDTNVTARTVEEKQQLSSGNFSHLVYDSIFFFFFFPGYGIIILM